MQKRFRLWSSKSPPVAVIFTLLTIALPLSVGSAPQMPGRGQPSPAGGSDPSQPAGEPGDPSAEIFDADAQLAKMAAIYSPGASLQMLQEHLRDRDPMINTAAFDAIGAHGKYRALEALLDVIDDTTEPTRLQALQLLLRAPDTDEAAVKRTLRAALKDPDPAFVAFAVETLAAGRDPEAENMLREALRDDNVLTRLLIVQSLGSSDAARPYLGYALSDPDKTVRKAAAALLNSSSPEETADR